MLNQLISVETIQVKPSVKDWKEAIRTASDPLFKKGTIHQDYVEAMINNVLEMGPYIVVAPRIALAHARPEQGVNQLGISLLCLKERVSFSKEGRHDVNLIIVLAAVNSETHLKVLSQLASLLSDDEGLRSIFQANSALEVSQLSISIPQTRRCETMKILVVCGVGLGSSFMIEMNVKKVLKELGIEAEVSHTDLTTGKSEKADYYIGSPEIMEQLRRAETKKRSH